MSYSFKKENQPFIKFPNNAHAAQTRRRALKSGSIVMALLPLAACGGGSSGGSPTVSPPPPPPPPPEPDFIESPTGTFTARDDNNRTLDEGSASADLTVLGKDGNDNITTGSGADKIRGGEGADTINAGAGDDVIVVVGTTTASQYTADSITNPAGSGVDLSSLITLADLNGRTLSEVVSGETIDGGTGNNTLYIYGTVDLTGVTLTNVTQLIVNSDVTLTQEQIAQFTTIDGDGNSVIKIVVPDGAGDVVLDLSAVDVSDVGSIQIDGSLTIRVSGLDDVTGITEIRSNDGDTLKLHISGDDTPADVSLLALAGVFSKVDSIDLGANIALVVDAPEEIAALNISAISGEGKIDTNGSPEALQALEAVNLSIGTVYAVNDTQSTPEDVPLILSIEDDILANDSALDGGDVSFNEISLSENSSAHATLVVDHDLGIVSITPNEDYYGTITLNYSIADTVGNIDNGSVVVNVSSVNDLPTAIGATAIVTVGETRKLSIDGQLIIEGILIDDDADQLNIDDVDGFLPSVKIRVENISHGEILLNGLPVSEFTYGDVENGLVEFSHSGGTEQPKLSISLSNDGVNYSQPYDVIVKLSDVNNLFTITQAGSITSNFVIDANEGYLVESADLFFYSNSISNDMTIHGRIDAFADFGYVTPLYFINSGVVTNYGSITAKGGADNAAAFYLEEQGSLINHGLLESTVPWQINGNNGDDTTFAYGALSQQVENTGTILASGKAAVGVIHSSGVDLDNSGIIKVNAAEEAAGVRATYGFSTVINSGLIKASSEDPTMSSIGLDFLLSAATVENSGKIEADIAISSLVNININNSGEIIGDLVLSAEHDLIFNEGVILGNLNFNGGNDALSNINGEIIGIVDGGAGDDILFGGAYADYFKGGNGADILATGIGGKDHLSGGAGNDIVLVESSDFEMVDGGDGVDLLSYALAPSAVNVNLSLGTGSIGEVQGGRILNVEDVTGSDFNDVLTGNSDANSLSGGTGDDVLNGGDGNDKLDGGSGADTIDGGFGVDEVLYDFSSSAVQINLSQGTATGGDAEGDIILNVTNIRGSLFDDNITGNDENNSLFGLDGNDTLMGGLGADYIDGGSGADVLSYENSSASVNINLSLGTATGGDAQGDSYVNIENITGSNFDDILSGDANYNILSGGAGNDILFAGVGNDILIGGAGADSLDGGDGNDMISYEGSSSGVQIYLDTGTVSGGDAEGDIINNIESVTGSEFADYIVSDSGNNNIYGLGGDDSLFGDVGADTLDGGEGEDSVNYWLSSSAVFINLELGTASGGYAEDDSLISIENIWGSNYNDILTGDAGSNRLWGNGGDDEIHGGAGNDILEGFSGADILDGGDGIDQAVYVNSNTVGITVNLLSGLGTGGNAEGDTYVSIENILGTEFDDNLYGNSSDNSLDGSWGNDVIYGEGGGDWLEGSLGNDVLFGGDGDDILNGGDGDDNMHGEVGADLLDGGAGNDTIGYDMSNGGVQIDLLLGTASGGDAEGDIIRNVENVNGSMLDDEIRGDDGDNILTGAIFGNDLLEGRGGNDTLTGGAGSDTLRGGSGDDTIIISNFNFVEIDGGDNSDILVLDGADLNLDLSIKGNSISGIEAMDLTGSGNNSVTFTLDELLNLSQTSNQLIISGDAGDSVTSSAQNWIQAADQVIDGQTYHVYSSGDATLLVDTDITQDIT